MNESFTKVYDELIMGFKGETLRDKGLKGKVLTNCQIHQSFPLSTFALYGKLKLRFSKLYMGQDFN